MKPTSLGVDLSSIELSPGQFPESWRETIKTLDELGESSQERLHRQSCSAMIEAQRFITGER